jgi:hypothetical protein
LGGLNFDGLRISTGFEGKRPQTAYSGRVFNLCRTLGSRVCPTTTPVFSGRVRVNATARPAQRRVGQNAQTRQTQPAGFGQTRTRFCFRLGRSLVRSLGRSLGHFL